MPSDEHRMTNVPQRVGNYRIEKPIGKGGSSQVLLARHVTLEDRHVAIKLLLSQDPESIERFQREANISSRLRHPNIVQIYDHGYQAPYHYTVMEYVAGGSLRSQMQGRPIALETTLHIFRCIGQALDYAHTNGVVHRDVSPGNILVEQGSNRVLLTDFGIAREAGKAGVTAIGNIMGTPGYLSPEHAQSATAVTHLSDIYSLGIVLYELLSGKLPWDHFPGMPPDSNGGPFTPPKTLRERGAELPGDVDRVMQAVLARDPAKRYPTAQAVAEELEQIFRRHTSPTVVVGPGGGATTTRAERPVGSAPLMTPQDLHPVERVLALDLLKGPMQEARRRAELLSNPEEIARLLDRWSVEGSWRKSSLGRQANLRRVQSSNVFFYTLRVLYETRTAAAEIEEPDYKAAEFKIEKAVDRWGVKLADPAGFKDEAGGTARLPGSNRVVACGGCNSLGRTICTQCEGRGRVARPVDSAAPRRSGQQPAARDAGVAQAQPGALGPGGPGGASGPGAAGGQEAVAAPPTPALVPCPECSGSGALRCKRCDGVGRLIQHKVTRWSRKASTIEGQDDMPRVDETWLRQSCQMREAYAEQQPGGFRGEWQQIPELAELIASAQKPVNGDTRVILSEVQIGFIPVTEIVFDLDPPAPEPDPGQKRGKPQKKPRRDGDLFTWYIYGFERRLPGDWRFLNWHKVLMWLFVALSLMLAIFLVVAMSGYRLAVVG
jgi:eukaryotic-like serine/threonine-protein kinase